MLDRAAVLSSQGVDRDEENVYVFLEYVPGGSITSLLDKFGAH